MPDLDCTVQEGKHWEEVFQTNKMGWGEGDGREKFHPNTCHLVLFPVI